MQGLRNVQGWSISSISEFIGIPVIIRACTAKREVVKDSLVARGIDFSKIDICKLAKDQNVLDTTQD